MDTTAAKLTLATDEMPVADKVRRALLYEIPVYATDFDVEAAVEVERETAALLGELIKEADELLG